MSLLSVFIRYQCRHLSYSSNLYGFKACRGTGDQGKSSLYSNERRWKDDIIFEALGSTDELNSIIGICRESANSNGLFDVSHTLTTTQCYLQDLASHMATPANAHIDKIEQTKFDATFVENINKYIDDYGDRIPPLKTFILAGGGLTGAHLQYARSLCRQTERRLVPLIRSQSIDPNCLRFINRLSDLLFVLGRYACMITNAKELSYQRHTRSTITTKH